MHRPFFRLLIALMAAALLLAPVRTAAAHPPPPGYPTGKVKTTAFNATLGPIPVRQGYFDADANQGFGFDKAYHKHNLYTLSAQKRIMLSPTISKQSNGNYRLTLYAGRYRCSGSTCTLVDKRTVLGIHDGRSYKVYRGWPVGGIMGMKTAYCKNPDRSWKCPNWVTPAIDHPGFRASKAEQSPSAEVADGPAPTFSAADRRLFADVASGRARLASSPTRLPTSIPAPR